MTANMANRLGIILAFVGSIMVAPELIGIKRLRKSEKWINRCLHLFQEKIKFIFEWLPKKGVKAFIDLSRFFWFIGLLLLPFTLVILSIPIALAIQSNAWFAMLFIVFGVWAYAPLVAMIVIGISDRLFALLRKTEPHPRESRVGQVIADIWNLPFLLGAAVLASPFVTFVILLALVSFVVLHLTEFFVHYSLKATSRRGSLRRLTVGSGLSLMLIGTGLQVYSTF